MESKIDYYFPLLLIFVVFVSVGIVSYLVYNLAEQIDFSTNIIDSN